MKKKALIFHQSGSIGGAGLSLLHILQSINRSALELVVVCPSNPPYMSQAISSLGIRVIPTVNTPVLFPHYNGGIKCALSYRSFINAYHLLRDREKIRQIISLEQPDIVIVNSMALAHIGLICKRFRFKTVCFDRETFQRGLLGVRTAFIKHCLSRYFDAVVFISKHDYDQLPKCRGAKLIINDKVDLKLYSNPKINDRNNRKAVLYLGGVSKLKGIHILLNSIDKVKTSDIDFYLVGDEQTVAKKPSLLDRILASLKLTSKSLARVSYFKLKNKQHVHFLLPTMTPEIYFRNADLIVFPSTVAHQARPLYEAGAAKIPIIISDFIETSEFCKNEDNAITVKPRNSNDLAKKIDYVFDSPIMVKHIVTNNYNRTLKEHNLDDLPDEMERLFDSL